jgi:hypothetical protein
MIAVHLSIMTVSSIYPPRIGKNYVMTGNREAAFFQLPDRGDVIPGGPDVWGPHLEATEELQKRLRGDALPQ